MITTARAVIGARVSVMRDGKVSPEVQRESGERYAAAHGWTPVGYFEDLDVSATVGPWDRPDLGPWLGARSGEWDAMIFAKVDRAFRSASDCADVVKWAEKNRKIIVFADDGIVCDYTKDTDSIEAMMSKFFLFLASLFGEMELRRIRSRTKGSHKKLKTTDRWAGGQPPYGYKVVPKPGGGKRLAVDPVSSLVVQEAGRMVLAGMSMWEVADALTAAGHPTPAAYVAAAQEGTDRKEKSKRRKAASTNWEQSSLGKILRSPATMGLKVTGRTVKDRTVARGADGMPVRMADPLFSDDDWGGIQARLTERSRTKERNHGAAPLLGIVYCAGCQSRLYRVVNTATLKNGETRTYEYYRCIKDASKPRCAGHTFKADELHRWIDSYVETDLAEVPEVTRRFVPGEDHTKELERVITNLKEVREEKDLGLYDYDGGDAEYRERLVALTGQRRALEALPHRADEWIEEPTGRSYAEVYGGMTDPAQRRALLLTDGVRLYCGPNYRHVQADDLQGRMHRHGSANAVPLAVHGPAGPLPWEAGYVEPFDPESELAPIDPEDPPIEPKSLTDLNRGDPTGDAVTARQNAGRSK
ncbi:recombinase family protein [Pseudonocardia sp. 73-21]|uniref:recombinase family protein n=1 Tax=Pseudonocardia sp. 73-21 TaxID=1895809 RepID=UPI000969DB6B|nr:recombinase family protein [Pseudonocardia sp. 73-21]OJY42237.1 MAG: hypothetical protein BGP03_10240 [Pseudonocardia sp. 73-21]